MKSPIRRYAPVIIWSGVIFALSSLPSTPAPETWWNFLLKKGAHVTEYAVLYWLTYRAMNEKQAGGASGDPAERPHPERVFESKGRTSGGAQRSDRTRHDVIGPLLFTILYAITDEIHQSFVPGRHGRWYDVGFDALGALIALLLIRSRNQNLR